MKLTNAERLGVGRTAEVFQWEPGQVLKLYYAWMNPAAVAEEFAISRAAQLAGLPIPAPIEQVELDGRHGIVFERVTGPTMLAVLTRQPWRLVQMGNLLGQVHAQMHSYHLPQGLPTQHDQLRYAIGHAPDLESGAKQQILDYLDRLPPGERLCHGDFHPDNILLTANGPIVIDWMTGRQGNPLGDLSRTSMLLRLSGLPDGLPAPVRLLIRSTRGLLHRIYLRRYRRERGISPAAIALWDIPVLAGRLVELSEYPSDKAIILKHLQARLAALQ